MPKWIEQNIGNYLPQVMTFAMPEAMRTKPNVTRLTDGSLILEAVPLVANQDLLYYGYELPLLQLFGSEVEADWDTKFIGRLTTECAEYMLDQFEGLAITDGHWDVEPGRRDEVAIGTFLNNAVLDNDLVRTRALIYSSPAIVKIDANGSELSIGGLAFMERNPKRGAQGEPDFFIHRIDLNHVALVENGRAGPDARLLNHRASLAHSKKEVPHMKVSISGVEIEVPDVVVNHFTGQISNLESQVDTLTTANSTLANSVGELTTARDTAQGALSVAQAELTTAQTQVVELTNSAPDITAAAAQIANEHSAFVTEAGRLGYTEELLLGNYQRNEVMLAVLNSRGAQFDAEANADTLKGAWAFALTNAEAGTRSVLDTPNLQPKTPLANVAAGAQAAVNASYFGGAKKKED